MQKLQHHPAILGLLILLAAAIAYTPGLGGGFAFDDYNNIVLNANVHMETLDAQSLKRAAGAYSPGLIGRPIATLSFAMDHYLGGKDPWAYKLSSLLVHLLNSLLIFLLARRLLALRAADGWHKWAAFAVALAWSLHPLQVSTVLYVVQRMEMLAATFVLLSISAYLAGRTRQIAGRTGWPWLLGAALLAGLGLLAKESAIATPLFTFALELTVLRFAAASTSASRILRWSYGVMVLMGALVYFGYVVPRYASVDAYVNRDFNMQERLLTQPRVLMMYLGQILIPVSSSMTFYYDTLPVSRGLFVPWTTFASILALAGMAAASWALRRRAPIASLGLMWFLVAHALTSNVLNLEMVFEHRNYLAILGIVLALADVVRRLPAPDGPGLKAFVVVVALVALGGLTTLRAATWGDPVLMAIDLVAKNPDSPRASNDLATVYSDLSRGDPSSRYFPLALAEFRRASLMPNSSPLPEQGLILLSATTGQTVEAAWWDSLIEKVRTQPIGPEQAMAVTGLMTQHGLGVALDEQRLGEAYLALLGRTTWPGYMYAQFGDFALTHLGDPALADEMFVAAVTRDPEDTLFAATVLATLLEDGHTRQAALVAEAISRPNPASSPETATKAP
jgi:hypothetical protein